MEVLIIKKGNCTCTFDLESVSVKELKDFVKSLKDVEVSIKRVVR